MIKDLIKVKDKVEYLLIKYPTTRDSDKELFLAYFVVFCGLKESLDGEYSSFRKWFLEKTPELESIRRCRQKHQEKTEHLRGKSYKHRNVEKEGVIEWVRKN